MSAASPLLTREAASEALVIGVGGPFLLRGIRKPADGARAAAAPPARSRRRSELRLARAGRALVVCGFALGLSGGCGDARADDDPTAPADLAEVDREEQDLRELLTEREDRNRVDAPFTVHVFGHPLSLSGELVTEVAARAQIDRGDPPDEDDRVIVLEELTGEAFYTLGPPLSFYLQGVAAYEADTLRRTRRGVSNAFVEREEMWVHARHVLDTPVDFEIGRLDFEDDRTFWYDETLDALRLSIEGSEAELQLSLARELLPIRSDEWFIDPESKDVLRLIAELSYDYASDHGVQAFVIHEYDASGSTRVGDTDDADREDESDAQITWFGARSTGVFQDGRLGLLGYWVDAALVAGSERVIVYGDEINGRIEVEQRFSRDVLGWAVDAGVTWAIPLPFEPRLTAGYAVGSGDRDTGRGSTHSFRQTRLQGNEPGFGGVQRFERFGWLLAPELSNLRIATFGLGFSLLRSSSLDLVYHRYRLDEPTDELRDAALVTPLNGRDRALGDALDIELAIEEGERFEFELRASGLRTGSAWGARRGEWVFGGFAAVRYAF